MARGSRPHASATRLGLNGMGSLLAGCDEGTTFIFITWMRFIRRARSDGPGERARLATAAAISPGEAAVEARRTRASVHGKQALAPAPWALRRWCGAGPA